MGEAVRASHELVIDRRLFNHVTVRSPEKSVRVRDRANADPSATAAAFFSVTRNACPLLVRRMVSLRSGETGDSTHHETAPSPAAFPSSLARLSLHRPSISLRHRGLSVSSMHVFGENWRVKARPKRYTDTFHKIIDSLYLRVECTFSPRAPPGVLLRRLDDKRSTLEAGSWVTG